MSVISFLVSGAFAAFRDPSVTTNQVAYHIPSKSAVIGMIGAMIGVERPPRLGDLYGDEYKNLFKTRIGLQMRSKPRKFVFFTNHTSLKKTKTKPFKTELLEDPEYVVHVDAGGDLRDRLSSAITNNKFAYAPYLGHAYCPASIRGLGEPECLKVEDPTGATTRCVVLDESETYGDDFRFRPDITTHDGSVVIERHIHHFFEDGALTGRVFKHWIPANGTEMRIREFRGGRLSRFYRIGDQVVCMY